MAKQYEDIDLGILSSGRSSFDGESSNSNGEEDGKATSLVSKFYFLDFFSFVKRLSSLL